MFTPFYRTRTLNVSTADKAHTTNFIQSNLVHTLKKNISASTNFAEKNVLTLACICNCEAVQKSYPSNMSFT